MEIETLADGGMNQIEGVISGVRHERELLLNDHQELSHLVEVLEHRYARFSSQAREIEEELKQFENQEQSAEEKKMMAGIMIEDILMDIDAMNESLYYQMQHFSDAEEVVETQLEGAFIAEKLVSRTNSELECAMHKMADLDADHTEYEKQAYSMQAIIDKIRSEMKNYTGRGAKFDEQLTGVENELVNSFSDLQNSVEESRLAEDQQKELVTEGVRLELEKRTSQQELQEMKTDFSLLEIKIVDMAKQLSSVNESQQLTELEQANEDQRMYQLETCLKTATHQHNQHQVEQQLSRKMMCTLESEMESLKEDIDDMRAVAEALEERNNQLALDFSHHSAKNESLRLKFEECNMNKQLVTDRYLTLRGTYDQCYVDIQKIWQDLTEAQRKADLLITTASYTRDSNAKLHVQIAQLAKEVDQNEEDISQLGLTFRDSQEFHRKQEGALKDEELLSEELGKELATVDSLVQNRIYPREDVEEQLVLLNQENLEHMKCIDNLTEHINGLSCKVKALLNVVAKLMLMKTDSTAQVEEKRNLFTERQEILFVEVNTWKEKIEALRKSGQSISADLEKLSAAKEDANHNTDFLQSKCNELRQQEEEYKHALQALTASYDSNSRNLQNQLDMLTTRIADGAANGDASGLNFEAISGELESLRICNANLQMKLAECKHELELMTSEQLISDEKLKDFSIERSNLVESLHIKMHNRNTIVSESNKVIAEIDALIELTRERQPHQLKELQEFTKELHDLDKVLKDETSTQYSLDAATNEVMTKVSSIRRRKNDLYMRNKNSLDEKRKLELSWDRICKEMQESKKAMEVAVKNHIAHQNTAIGLKAQLQQINTKLGVEKSSLSNTKLQLREVNDQVKQRNNSNEELERQKSTLSLAVHKQLDPVQLLKDLQIRVKEGKTNLEALKQDKKDMEIGISLKAQFGSIVGNDRKSSGSFCDAKKRDDVNKKSNDKPLDRASAVKFSAPVKSSHADSRAVGSNAATPKHSSLTARPLKSILKKSGSSGQSSRGSTKSNPENCKDSIQGTINASKKDPYSTFEDSDLSEGDFKSYRQHVLAKRAAELQKKTKSGGSR